MNLLKDGIESGRVIPTGGAKKLLLMVKQKNIKYIK